MRLLITLFTINLLLFSSCTVQKRLFLSGYSVQWKGKSLKSETKITFDISKETPHEIARVPKTNSVTPQERILSKGNIVADSSLKNEPVSVVKTDHKAPCNSEAAIKTVTTQPENKIDDPAGKLERKTSRPRTHPLAIISFGTAILTAVALILGAFTPPMFGIAIGLFVATLILAGIALGMIKKNPEKYFLLVFCVFQLFFIIRNALLFID